MNTFVSYTQLIKSLLLKIIACDQTHAKWLNTLSYLENCGARKIAACEHPTMVKEEMLKHAAEEFRHAHYLKRQIAKLSAGSINTYANHFILGGVASRQYLAHLDLKTSCYLKKLGFNKKSIKEAAYLLVTYAIELRAAELYALYNDLLKKTSSKVTVSSILLEEKEHLNEMKEGIEELHLGFLHAQRVSALEGELCKQWLCAIDKSI